MHPTVHAKENPDKPAVFMASNGDARTYAICIDEVPVQIATMASAASELVTLAVLAASGIAK